MARGTPCHQYHNRTLSSSNRPRIHHHFITTIIGMGAGPQAVGTMNDLIGTPDAIRYSLLGAAIIMNLISVVFFWLAGQSLVEDLEAKKRL